MGLMWHDGSTPIDTADRVARWSAGPDWSGDWVWANSFEYDERARASTSSNGLHTSGKINELMIAFDGILVPGDALQSAQWTLGRPGWFDVLGSSSASFVIRGSVSVMPGSTVTVADADRAYWTGRVDTVTTSEDMDGTVYSSVTATDLVGVLGASQLNKEDIPSGTLAVQAAYACELAGIDVEIEIAPSNTALPTLDAITDFEGTVLDLINRGERSSNAICALTPVGNLSILVRDALPGYETQVTAGYWSLPPSSHWPMDESSGTIEDVVAAVDGTSSGSPTYGVEGPWGPSGPTAISFDDTNDTINFGNNHNLTADFWSLTGWAWWTGPGSGDDDFLMHKATGGNGWYLYISNSTGRLDFQGFSGGASTENIPDDAPSCPVEEWFHWAVVRDDTAIYLYVNGSEVARGTAGTISLSAANLHIGSFGGFANWFDGRICQVSVWGVSLTQDQIQWLTNSGSVNLTRVTGWDTALDLTGVINSWQLTKADETAVLNETDAASVAAYGLRAYSVTDYLLGTSTHFTSGLKAAMAIPRSVLTRGELLVDSYADFRTLRLRPFDLIDRDGKVWQVLQVQHNVSITDWKVTVAGDQSQTSIVTTTTIDDPDPVVPVTPPAPPDDPTTVKTITQTYDAQRDSTAYLSSGGAKYGNGTGNRLQVGLWQGGRGRAFIRFNISWPTGFIRVKKAVLKLRTSDQLWVAFGSQPRIVVQRVTESWSEGSFDASPPNQFSANALIWPGPSRTTSGQKYKDVTESESTWIEIVITDIAETWHYANNGLALLSANEDSTSRTTEFYSRETGSEPRLVLTCEVTA